MAEKTSPTVPASERTRLAAVSAALPAIAALAPRFATAATYLAAWIVPQQIPSGLVKGLFLGMVLEFLLIHSYVFLNLAAGAAPEAKPGDRLRGALAVLGFGVFYLLMAAAIGWATKSFTPLWAIGWLLAARIFEIAVAGDASAAVADSRLISWLRHVLLYILLATLTAVVPLPAFGLSSDVVAGLGLSGSGTWVEKPQSVLAFGFLYFGLGAYLDLRARLKK
jgi:hypothetical protein